MERTDIHRPSAIVPGDYQFVAHEYIPGVHSGDIGACRFLLEQREIIRKHMAKTGGTYASHEHGGNCMVCGSVNAVYTILFHHRPSNTYVRMGADCAEKCMQGGDFGASRFRQAINDARAAHAGKRKAQAILSDAGLSGCWDVYESTGFRKQEEMTIIDIVGKLVKYGSISVKQENFLRSLLERIATRGEREAKQLAEREAAANCPEGRITVEGTVLSVKVVDSQFGSVTKCLVKHDSGYKVWGTRPSGTNAEKGDRLRFTATITPSKDDPKFGFFSRPAKASVVTGPQLVPDPPAQGKKSFFADAVAASVVVEDDNYLHRDAKRFGYDRHRWFDMVNAMDSGEYDQFVKRLEMANSF